MNDWRREPEPPGPDQILRLLLMLADPIGFAHHLDPPVVHRDLKPSNVLVQWLSADRMQLKVADFGIGGLAALSRRGSAGAETVRGLLQPTLMRGAGSQLYSSPQQLAGASPDPRDDVFSLGVIWYQLLTGNWGQGRPGGVRWARQLLERGVPAEHVDLLTSCLEELPADRPTDGMVLAQQLESILYQEPLGFVPLPIPSEPAPAVVSAPKPKSPQILCIKANEVIVSSLAPSRDSKQVLVAGGGRERKYGTTGTRILDCNLRTFDLESGKELRCFTGHNEGILATSWCLNNRSILSGGQDNTVRCWDATTGKERFRFTSYLSTHGIAVSPDGKVGLSGGVQKVIQVWDLTTGKAIRELRGHTDTIRSIVFSPNGGLALSASEDKTLRLWVLAQGRESRRLTGHTNWVMDAHFLPDGRHAVSAGFDETLRVWDLATGRQIRVFEMGVTGTSLHGRIATSPDGRRLLYPIRGNAVGLLDLETGRDVTQFRGHTDSVMCVGFTPDGQKGLSGSMDGTVRVWKLPT